MPVNVGDDARTRRALSTCCRDADDQTRTRTIPARGTSRYPETADSRRAVPASWTATSTWSRATRSSVPPTTASRSRSSTRARRRQRSRRTNDSPIRSTMPRSGGSSETGARLDRTCSVQGERVDGGEREDAGPLLARRGIARDGQLPRHPVASEHLGPEVDPRAVRQRQAQRPRLIGRGESPQAVAHDGARDAGALLLGALIPLLGEPRRLPLALEIVEEVLPPHRSPDPRRRRERGDGEDSYIRVTLGPFLEIRSQFSTSCALNVRRASRTVTVDQSSWSPDRGGSTGMGVTHE